jgi:ubiquinone/menaquinone biosynthesis C-methylase UbiE
MDAETEFLKGLIGLQYGEVDPNMVSWAKSIPWATGWPESNHAFWNAEAFMWRHKIKKATRKFICCKLNGIRENNLDLGCGAYSYVKNSVGIDCSEKMLQFNEQCMKKIVANIEELLPFPDGAFTSLTAVFVLNYIAQISSLLAECHRILQKGGSMVIVLSATPINAWQKQKQLQENSPADWQMLFKNAGFTVTLQHERDLLFFTCTKRLLNFS